MSNKNIDLIRQALNAAEASIKLSRQLLADLEGGGQGANPVDISSKPKANELPGITGTFDGENMTSETGETFPVPANYASKSLLVVGDTLKLVEEGKEKRFKQIEHVKRHKTTGIITKKEGKWRAVTPEGSYKVLPAAIAHFGADVGSEVVLHLPSDNLTVPYGAIESVKTVVKETTDSQEKEPTEAVTKEKEPEETKPKETEKSETETKEKEVAHKEPEKKNPPQPRHETKEPPRETKPEVKQEVVPAKVEVKQEVKKEPETPKPVEIPVVEKPKTVEPPVEKSLPVAPVPVVEKPVVPPVPAAVPMEVVPEEDELT